MLLMIHFRKVRVSSNEFTQVPIPANNLDGRDNNQGFEGLTVSHDGRYLYALLQSALNQDGGLAGKSSNQNARLVKYDITIPFLPQYVAEYVVTLPKFNSGKSLKTAAQSEIHFISDTQFFVLARDSSAGHGQASSTSLYRHIDVFDISGATNIKSKTNDAANASIASAAGVLNPGIVAAQYCSFLDFNVNSQLNRFGVRNGGAQDANLLNEKWESIALLPVDGKTGADGEYFVFSFSDNDFITQTGHLNFGKFSYADGSGYTLDNQALVFQVTLPKGSTPS
jgi:hypothetical protein